LKEGQFKRLEALVGKEVDEDKMREAGFLHYVFGKDIAYQVDVLTGRREDTEPDQDEVEAIRSFFGDDCWMKYVPMSDRELKGNQIYDASFLLGITLDQDEVITSAKEYLRIGVPFAGEMPVISGLPVPVYYDYMPVNYCPRYVVRELTGVLKDGENRAFSED
jgi:hypothetical protein